MKDENEQQETLRETKAMAKNFCAIGVPSDIAGRAVARAYSLFYGRVSYFKFSFYYYERHSCAGFTGEKSRLAGGGFVCMREHVSVARGARAWRKSTREVTSNDAVSLTRTSHPWAQNGRKVSLSGETRPATSRLLSGVISWMEAHREKTGEGVRKKKRGKKVKLSLEESNLHTNK